MIKLQAGKFYKTRDGQKVGPMVKKLGLSADGYYYPWDDTSNKNHYFWSHEGKCYDGPQHDLIAEWTDTPTIWADDEGWGDWTIAEEWDVTNNDVQFECVGGIHKVRTRPRIKPEPKRETVKRGLHGAKFMGHVAIDMIDDVPQWDTMRPWDDSMDEGLQLNL